MAACCRVKGHSAVPCHAHPAQKLAGRAGSWLLLQANLTKQLAKLVKVKYVEDITDSTRVGEAATCPAESVAVEASPLRL